jgi:outer membrane murein-binding lipoprotein Lpp
VEKGKLEVTHEDLSGKFDLVLEGHAALDKKLDTRFDELNEKIENNSFKIDTLNKKIDGVASDLKAHRSDTEAHHGVYGVRED